MIHMGAKKTKVKHAHLVGIKGVAMASLAVYLTQSGVKVTGSDVPEDFPTQEELKAAGISVLSGFDPARVVGKNKPDVLYYTGAHGGRENPEVKAAIAEEIPTLPHGAALGEMMRTSRQIVVAGSHGKTTTSAMIAVLLSHAHYHPSFAIGCGSIPGLGEAGHKGKGSWFVAEGDEYVTDPTHDLTPRFLWLDPEILVVTNIDYDHPDAYPDLAAVQHAFLKVQQKSNILVMNADDPNSRILKEAGKVLTYGFSPSADYRISHVGVGDQRMFFTLEERGVKLGEFSLKVPGQHNVSNAVAAMIAAHMAGASWDTLREGLLQFTGTKRRFEKLGLRAGITFYDDYAHHPTEIAATLKAARFWYPKERIIAVFQPHTYSRTKTLLAEFGRCFTDADTVILTDIYASAREKDSQGMTGMTLVSETIRHHRDVRFASDKAAVLDTLTTVVNRNDVVIFMGAGDIYNWEQDMIESFGKHR